MVIGLRKPSLRSAAALMLGASVAIGAGIWYLRSTERRPPPDSPSTVQAPVSAVGQPVAEHADEGWVGSRKCAECHSDIWQKYQSHPMAQSAASVLKATVIEDYSQNTSFSRPDSRTYRVERTPEHIWHHEAMTDAQGRIVYDQAVEVHYEIGSGKRGRSYLIDHGGLMTLSPITWYTEGSRWDLSPGYKPLTHQRFNRRVIDGCLVCHVGRLSFDPEKPDRYGTPALLETEIGCERCHGPGRDHVRMHEEPQRASAGRNPIINPSQLEPASREDVCNQCHLQGQRILRQGRTTHDFRPGQRLEDVWAVFMKGAGIEHGQTTRAVGQVDQMRESTCFQRSAGRLGCTSCHDPHSVPTATESRQSFDRRCHTCHDEKGCSLPISERSAAPAAGSCVACHMQRFPASNVPHTSQTDHRILRDPARSDVSPARSDELFDGAESRLPPIELRRARGLLLAGQSNLHPEAVAGEQLESLLLPVLRQCPDDVEVLTALGSLRLRQRREVQAEEFLLRVLQLRPEQEDALHQMAMLETERGHSAAAIAYLERCLVINPRQAAWHGWLAQLLWTAGRRDAALETAEQGLQLDPTLLHLRKWQAQACRQAGRLAEAAEQDQFIRRMQNR